MFSITNLRHRLPVITFRILLAGLTLVGGFIFAVVTYLQTFSSDLYQMNQLRGDLAVFAVIMLIVVLGFQFYFIYPFLSCFSALSRAFACLKNQPDCVPDIKLSSFAKIDDTSRLISDFLDMAAHIRHNRLALNESKEKFRQVAQVSNDVIWEWDYATGRTLWSRKISSLIGFEPNVTTMSFEVAEGWIHPEDRNRRRQALVRHFSGECDYYSCEYRVFDISQNDYRWVWARGKAALGADRLPARMVGSLTDITPKKRRDEEIRRLAYFDQLTKLPNRASFVNRLKLEMEPSEQRPAGGAIMFIGLNDFKRVNGLFGHSSGDELLIKTAAEIKEVLGERGTVFRLGGDEFIILAPGLDQEHVGELAQQLVQELIVHYTYQDQTFIVSGSIGVALYPQDGTDAEELLSKADTAMYHAKGAHKAGYSLFHPSMHELAIKNLKLESLLSKAIERNELQLHYQPQVDLTTNRPVCVEALLRWNCHGIGMVSPVEFIPIAEKSGLILPIGDWVLAEACKLCKTLQAQAIDHIYVTVNISPRQVEQPDFVDKVQRILEENQLDPGLLELEITESLLMTNIDGCQKKIETLRKMGIRLALDDFGTGYSSLTRLRRLPFDVLKVDKEFIRAVNGEDTIIVETIVSLSHTLGMQVVAEGVEEKIQAEFLKRMNCDRVQGFYFSRPLSEENLQVYLQSFAGEKRLAM